MITALALFLVSRAIGKGAISESALDQPIESPSGSPRNRIIDLCVSLDVPCGIEEFDEASISRDEPEGPGPSSTTARQLLDSFVAKHPAYSWRFSDGMIHVRYSPKGSAPFENPLDKTIDSLAIRDKLSFLAMGEVLKKANIRAGFGFAGPTPRYARITLSLQSITVRDAFDQIAKADGKVAWWFCFSPSGKGNNRDLISWHIQDGIGLWDDIHQKERRQRILAYALASLACLLLYFFIRRRRNRQHRRAPAR